MKIKDLILKTEKVNWQELKDLQPVDLKNNYHSDKTKKSIIENGFARAIYVWQDQEDIYIVDGHLRSDVLRELKNDGYEIPDKLNCTFLDLPDKITAIKYLLQVFNQKTNPINHFNMENWLGDLEINLATDLKIDIEELHVELPEVEEEAEEEQEEVKEDEVPELKHNFVIKGDLFELVDEEQGLTHRVLCGDSLNETDTTNLMNGELATLAHNDPPYGMKKEKDGVKNDNLNYDDLLEFNKDWISLQFTYLKDNGSWYCWGIDEPLMDIYSHILKPLIKTQKATFRNLITWNKSNGQGQMSEEFRSYAIADEKCLFVMCGVQGFNNNADNYFEGWESIRDYLLQSRLAMGWDVPTMKRIVGHSDLSRDHWTSKSQFSMPTREVYNKMKMEADRLRKEIKNDAFKKEYDELKKEYYSTRAYFNNTHDNMNNVWNIERTSNAERDGVGKHATPKPLKLCERAIKSSSREKDLVIDFFLGSGSTLITCQQTKRKCYGIELDEHYCGVVITRWKNYMEKEGKKYSIKRNGEEFSF
jgi:DNA modification methylase